MTSLVQIQLYDELLGDLAFLIRYDVIIFIYRYLDLVTNLIGKVRFTWLHLYVSLVGQGD